MCFQRLKQWLKKLYDWLTEEPPVTNGGDGKIPANTFLFIEPQQHYLEYSSKVIHDLIAANKNASQQVVELIGADANEAKIKEALTSLNPAVFSGTGHGNYTTYTVECTSPFMKVGDPNVQLFKGRVVHLNSCETAADLGPALISAGATAYVGSNESFWFYTGDPANSTRAVQSPFLCEWQFDVSLLQGKTVADARADMVAKYEEELAYWVTGDGKNHPDAGEIARLININKSISVFLGEGQTTPSPGGGGGGALSVPPEVAVPVAFGATFAFLWMVLH